MATLKETLRRLAPEFGVNLAETVDDQAKAIEDDVLNKLETSVKFDEVDTVTFGLETDDGKIVKVYVKAEQSEDFEKALSDKLGAVDDIEEVLNELSKEFDIIDVEWPEADAEDPDAVTGSEVLDPKVYDNAKERSEMDKELDPALEGLNIGERAALALLENSQSIESRFTTATQLMVYHAILELGIPEIVLNRSPYRASIVKAIRAKADELNRNSSLKTALKMFIKRTDDFDQKAKENEQAEVKEAEKATPVVQTTTSDKKPFVISEDKCEWTFNLDKDEFKISCGQLSVTLNTEETEKVIKGITNRDAVVVRDAEENTKKYVFSPRGSSVVVKQVGSAEGFTMTSKDVDAMLTAISPEQEPVAEGQFKIDHTKNMIDNFEAWVGSDIKVGRNVLFGYPVLIDDSDGTFLEIMAVDADAAKGLMKKIKSAGFVVKLSNGRELSVDMPARVSENVAPGYFIVDKNRNRVSGPFNSESAARSSEEYKTKFNGFEVEYFSDYDLKRAND